MNIPGDKSALRRRRRAAITLVELLVVIAIVMSLLASALPILAPALEDRSIREAARELEAVIGQARTRSVSSGKPAGVIFERGFNPRDTVPKVKELCVRIYIAEPGAIYSGDSFSSRARVASDNGQISFTLGSESLGSDPDKPMQGGLLQLNYQGDYYPIKTASAAALTVDRGLTSNRYPPKTSDHGVPFQVYCRPRKSSETPLILPETVAIDLQFSGVDGVNGHLFPNDTNPIAVMFSPSGAVDRVYSGTNNVQPVRRIHFLLGEVAKVPARNGPTDPEGTLQDFRSLWVSIGPQTGLTSTTENRTGNIDNARQYARAADSMGGR